MVHHPPSSTFHLRVSPRLLLPTSHFSFSSSSSCTYLMILFFLLHSPSFHLFLSPPIFSTFFLIQFLCSCLSPPYALSSTTQTLLLFFLHLLFPIMIIHNLFLLVLFFILLSFLLVFFLLHL